MKRDLSDPGSIFGSIPKTLIGQELIAVGILSGIGLILRAYNLAEQSLWFDELLSVSISRLGWKEVILSPGSIDPPLYYLLLHFWLYISSDDITIRSLSALAGVFSVPALYILGRECFDRKTGVLAALIMAIAPLQLFYAQEARMYSLLVLFSILSIWAYIRAQTLNRKRDWIIWVTMMALAIYTHTFAGLVLLALDLDALIRWYRKRQDIKPAMLGNIALGLALFPSLLLVIQKLEWLLPALWLKSPVPLHLILTLYAFMFGYTLPPVGITVGLFVLLLTLVFVFMSAWRQVRSSPSPDGDGLFLMSLILALPPLVTFIASQWRPVYLDRLLLESSPALYILIAWGLVRSDRRRILRVSALIGLLLILWADVNYYVDPKYQKSPLREAIGYVAERNRANETVIHTSDSSFLAGMHYDPAGRHVLLYHPADQWLIPALMEDLHVPYVMDMTRAISDHSSFWLVVALDHIEDEQRAEKAIFDQNAIVTEEREVGDIYIFHYSLR